MLGGVRVLLVEDDYFTALDLKVQILASGGEVVGPYSSVASALDALKKEQVAAAILDANLTDRDITPVVLVLVHRRVPLVIHTGVGLPDDLLRTHPTLPVIMKPADPTVVVAALAEQIANQALN